MTAAPPLPDTSLRNWHTLDANAVLSAVESSAGGLSSVEAARRLAANGLNTLQESEPIRPGKILAAQFKSLIVWVLIVAAVVSGAVGEWIDCIAILAIVLLNGVIGFYQEFSAEKSIAALKKMTAPRAKVIRGGQILTIPAAETVTGDIVELDAGDLVPADARLLHSSSLRCVESALTGESDAVSKSIVALSRADVPLGDRVNMVFMGTIVSSGNARAVVVGTGMQTEIGGIAHLIEDASASATSPLQTKLAAFGRVLIWASLGVVALLFVLGLLRGLGLLDIFMTSISLAVAAVPEGLPAVVTVSLALGVMRMARQRALVRKLPSVETLGSTNVICTDKTGTLTVGEMTVRTLFIAGETFAVTGEGYSPIGAILSEGEVPTNAQRESLRLFSEVMVGSNNAHLVEEKGRWTIAGDPTEGALLVVAAKFGTTVASLNVAQPQLREIPFDSDRKRRTVVRQLNPQTSRVYVNGAPDILLSRCTRLLCASGIRPLTEQERQAIVDENSKLAHSALRVLASAYRDIPSGKTLTETDDATESELVFVGLIGLYDPPRAEVKAAIARCNSAGIRVVMITGDHPHTALAIARELEIAKPGDLAISGSELDRMSDEELSGQVSKAAVFARVTAAHKLRIIRAWKANNAVVAMTGDGVNDAPAIKGADIGIAMGKSGTEVTKQASDIIIADDNFASIVAAVEEGRGIYDNIRKTLQYLLAGNAGELLLMTVCVIIGLPAPLLPIHLLWINLVTDGFPALCLAADPIDSEVMKRKPRARNEQIANGGFLGTMFLTGMLTAGVALGVYLYALRYETQELARTHAFAALVFAELLRAFGCRSETKPLWRIPLFSNLALAFVVAISFGLQVLSHHNAMLARFLKTSLMSTSDCLMLLALASIPLVVLECVKLVRSRSSRVPLMCGQAPRPA
jgi:P-type Ca2+ transporter type 2C